MNENRLKNNRSKHFCILLTFLTLANDYRFTFFENIDQFVDQIFGQVFDQILARFLTRFLARVLTINTVYSTTGTEKYSVQYYSDGKIYYTLFFLLKSIYFFLVYVSKSRY